MTVDEDGNPIYVGFASDNYAPAHPQVMKFIEHYNRGFERPYNDDSVTEIVREKISALFGKDVAFFPVLNGTGSNVLSLRSILPRYASVIAPETAHIVTDESAAPEHMAGIKTMLSPSPDGKLTVDGILSHKTTIGNIHSPEPGAISISNTTELGTIYKPDEVAELAKTAHELGLLVHLDGARIFNALAATNSTLKEMIADTGVDIVSFGCTKLGAVSAESIVVLNENEVKNVKYSQKQMSQLSSKARYTSAQFLAMFAPYDAEAFTESLTAQIPSTPAGIMDSLAYLLAQDSNDKAQYFYAKLKEVLATNPPNAIDIPPAANALFPTLTKQMASRLRDNFHFYDWKSTADMVQIRLMASFLTTTSDIDRFVQKLSVACKE
ncbi:MAG: hypothetical protein LBL41_02595 [Bifidobacteriaceae bacterium]|nr:hypothetical protein [Bifidobacteriaceae bacterium]